MKKVTNYIAIILLISGFVSCKKWIEVKPKTQVEAGVFFENQQGFEEALNGVYIQMGDPGLYGKEMTYGLADILGGQYILPTTANASYLEAQKGLYTGGVRTVTNAIWTKSYTAIANLNKVIEAVDIADSTMFTGKRYHVIKGEAYGLRAFLHFELLRWYGVSYLAGGSEIKAIPYKKKYSTEITPRETAAATIANVLSDLEIAAQELKADEVFTGAMTVGRRVRFNYYAVKALQARAWQWAGETDKALAAAEEVIAVATSKFPLVTQAVLTVTSEEIKDRTFSTEHIFALKIDNIADYYEGLLDTSSSGAQLSVTTTRLAEQFETSIGGNTDWRYLYLIRTLSLSTGNILLFGKLYQPPNYTANYAKRIPLIRIPEMYYIAAEALAATDPAKAATYLNTVRARRGITTQIASNLSAADLQMHTRMEYWKEFPLEGQVFFYYKRTGSNSIPGVTGVIPASQYTLLLPELELEFGL